MPNPRRPRDTAAASASDLHADEQRPIEARKQTEHKLDVWRRYTARYLSIIAKANEKSRFFRGERVFIVDLFAGAGRHLSAENPLREVPGTAALACYAARSVQRKHRKTKVHVRLSDADEVMCRRLEAHVAEYTDAIAFPDRVDVTIENADYVNRIEPILAETHDEQGRNYCSLWLLDPFGLDLPMSSLLPILDAPGTEVIVNLDAGAVRREIIAVTDTKSNVTPQQRAGMSACLDRLFGGDSWRRAFDGAANFETELIGIARTYADAFASNFTYRNPYKLRSSDGQHRYLIHLSNHPSAAAAFEKDYKDSLKIGDAKGNARDWTDRTKISAMLMDAFPGVEMTMEELRTQTVVLLTKQQAEVIQRFACDQGFATLNKQNGKLKWNTECTRAPELELFQTDTSQPGAQLDFFN